MIANDTTIGITAVFWSEGSIACAIVSDVTPENTIAGALANARKAA
jgi:hypothetical protein